MMDAAPLDHMVVPTGPAATDLATDHVATDHVATERVERIPHALLQPVLATLVQLTDLLLLLLAGLPARAASASFADPPPHGAAVLATLLAAAGTSVCLACGGTAMLDTLRSGSRQIVRVLLSLLAGATVLTLTLLVQQPMAGGTGLWVGCWLLGAAVLILGFRLVLMARLRAWATAGKLARRIAVVGANPLGRAACAVLGRQREAVALAGIYSDAEPTDHGLPLADSLDDLLRRGRLGLIDDILIALPDHDSFRLGQICERLSSVVSDVHLLTYGLSSGPATGPAADLASLPRGRFAGGHLITLSRRPLQGWQLVQKAVLDRVLTTLLLVSLLPLLAAVALAIRLDSRGPVLFRQRRLGFNNRMFVMFKFRTMQHAMADEQAQRLTRRNDPRITRVGKWLRRTSLDELPQLLNVLRGEMSLVGPRPHAPMACAGNRLYGDVAADYVRRHRVKPGITGWAQVNGWRGETTTAAQIQNRVKYDLHYIENWSIGLDVKILLLTVLREIFSKHAF